MNGFVKISAACDITGLSGSRLRKLVDENKVKSYRTPSGQRMLYRRDLEAMCYPVSIDIEIQANTRRNFLYARVSSKQQSNDLDRQITYLQHFRPEYLSYTTLSDIGSGANYKRRGLQTILDACIQQTIGEVVVAHRDRLARFSFDLIESIVQKAGGKITVLADTTGKTGEQDLAEDLLSIVQIYCCRQMGRRKYKKSEAGNPPHTGTKETNGTVV
jgi:putative resolvase